MFQSFLSSRVEVFLLEPLLPPHPSSLSMSALNSTFLHSVAGEDNQLVASIFGIAAVLATTLILYSLGYAGKTKEHEFPKLPGIQSYHAWNFFRQRHDFLRSGYKQNSGKSFYFKVLTNKIIALSGEDARQIFFSNSHLSVDEGYKILMGAVRIPFSPVAAEPFTDIGNPLCRLPE